MGLTHDPGTPGLPRGIDEEPRRQAEVYLVLRPEELAKGFLLPVRRSYRHRACDAVTTMGAPLAETYARDPWFYGGTYCATCCKHRPLSEFRWLDGQAMAPAEWTAGELAAVMARRAEVG